jgi:DNA-binding transcriptional MerR regulator
MTIMGEDRAIAEELLAVPIETAARLAGVSVRRVRYWDQTKLVVPSIRRQQGRIILRLYDFQDLVELLAVTAMLRSPGISLQHVRKVVAYLAHQRGYESPLREVRYAVAGGEVFFMDELGNWAGGRAPDQIVEHRVLPLAEIRNHVRRATERPAEAAGRTVQRRKVAGFKPCSRAPASQSEPSSNIWSAATRPRRSSSRSRSSRQKTSTWHEGRPAPHRGRPPCDSSWTTTWTRRSRRS